MNRNITARSAVTAGLILLTAVSCVYIDEELGSNFIPDDRRYEVQKASFPLTRIKVGLADSLSGYSSNRITVGEISDGTDWEVYGSAFTLIPVNEKPDFGKNRNNVRFHFTAVRDTFSVRDADQMYIPQNIYVYALKEHLDEDYMYIGGKEPLISGELGRISYTTYNGGDSLSFNFTEAYADHVISTISSDKMTDEVYNDVEKYAELLPGIYISPQPLTAPADGEEETWEGLKAPQGSGGRINMFELPIKISDSYYVTGNYAELAFTADYGERKQVDTSFLFYFGPQERKTSTTQYALNVSRSSSMEKFRDDPEFKDKVSWEWKGSGEDRMTVEGGAGLKPVISAAEIKKLITDELVSNSIDPNTVIINKATIVLPYEWNNDFYNESYRVPQMLNPTSRITGKAKDGDSEDAVEKPYVTYAGLTDASRESENQGNVDRSLMRYAPDVSHHVQTILKLDADAELALSAEETEDSKAEAEAKKFEDYDIWMLIMAEETVIENQDNSYMDEYYQNMAYANYYNSMYDPYGYGYGGYGYGGYGYGYGSYGYGYNNYYNYLAMSQMASNQGSKTSKVTQLDKDRYYRCELAGPVTEEGWERKTDEEKKTDINTVPHLKIVYSYIKPEK